MARKSTPIKTKTTTGTTKTNKVVEIKELGLMGNLKLIQSELNKHENEEDSYRYEFYLSMYNDAIFKVLTDDVVYKTYVIATKDDMTSKDIIKLLIKQIYENDINEMSKYVSDYNNFVRRKAKSLVLWHGRNDIKKVEKINEEMIKRYSITDMTKMRIVDIKSIVRDLYRVLQVLFPRYKAEDLLEKYKREIEHYNLRNVEVQLFGNYIVVSNDAFNINSKVEIQEYSNKVNTALLMTMNSLY